MGQGMLEAALRDLIAPIIREEITVALERIGPRRQVVATAAAAPPAPIQMGDYLLTFQEVAAILKRAVRTIRRRVAAGELRVSDGDHNRITRFEVDRYMSEGPRRPEPGGDEVEAEVDRLFRRK